jgi:hypothetical protein
MTFPSVGGGTQLIPTGLPQLSLQFITVNRTTKHKPPSRHQAVTQAKALPNKPPTWRPICRLKRSMWVYYSLQQTWYTIKCSTIHGMPINSFLTWDVSRGYVSSKYIVNIKGLIGDMELMELWFVRAMLLQPALSSHVSLPNEGG